MKGWEIADIKQKIKAIPVLGPLAQRALRGRFTTSPDYWERRYRSGGNSGFGSYGRLAEFKAQFLNAFVKENDVRDVIEFGCGNGAQLELADYPDYTGVDISRSALADARRRFGDNRRLRFLHLSELEPGLSADLALSLDVIFHLVEDEIFDRHMRLLFDSARRFVIIYSSNFDERTAEHVRHRKFTDWIEANRRDAKLLKHVPNRYPFDPSDAGNTSVSDFYLYALE